MAFVWFIHNVFAEFMSVQSALLIFCMMFVQVTRYWPEKGKSGFIVWRYEMRRDDPVPPPWTKEGQKRIEKLGLEMQVGTRFCIGCY